MANRCGAQMRRCSHGLHQDGTQRLWKGGRLDRNLGGGGRVGWGVKQTGVLAASINAGDGVRSVPPLPENLITSHKPTFLKLATCVQSSLSRNSPLISK